jgi:hypothetical protein
MTVADYEDWLIRLCIWREARNQPKEVWTAIWSTILNRKDRPDQFGATIAEVILKPYAFSSFNPDSKDAVFPKPLHLLDWRAWLAILLLPVPYIDTSENACFYESVPVAGLPALREKAPWFAAEKMTKQIGDVRFYRA